MGDLKDMQGFDPNSSLAMDQSIHVGPSDVDQPFNHFISEQPFNPDVSIVQRSNTVPNKEAGTILDEIKPHPGSSLEPEAQADFNQAPEEQKNEAENNEEQNQEE